MARPRKELDKLLRSCIQNNHVYFQPPPNFQMEYDCIVYSLVDYDVTHADNKGYRMIPAYKITYISRKPDETVVPKIMESLHGRFDTSFISDNLYHYVITVYF